MLSLLALAAILVTYLNVQLSDACCPYFQSSAWKVKEHQFSDYVQGSTDVKCLTTSSMFRWHPSRDNNFCYMIAFRYWCYDACKQTCGDPVSYPPDNYVTCRGKDCSAPNQTPYVYCECLPGRCNTGVVPWTTIEQFYWSQCLAPKQVALEPPVAVKTVYVHVQQPAAPSIILQRVHQPGISQSIPVTGGGVACDYTNPQRPDLNGKLLTAPSGATYLIIDGCRRLVPSWTVYDNMFRTRECIHADPHVERICVCDNLSDWAQIGQFGSSPPRSASYQQNKAVFLWTNNMKHWIATGAAFERFCFDWNKVQIWPQNEDDVPVAQNIS